MKRSISLLLALVMVLALTPAVLAYAGPAASSNINDHFYINANRWTDPIKSTLAADGDGYLRVEYINDRIVVEHYDKDLNYVSGEELAQELPVYGGVYICDDYNFVVTGQNNTEEDDSKEVFRITRYDKDWQKLDHASLFGANTVYPFDAGCVRFDRSGDILYIRTSHEMYTSSDGLNHQANVFIALRISDMTVTDSFTDVLNKNYGYVSHSFNQFVRVDGETLLAVDHGDAHPRSVVLIKYGKKAGEETFFGRVTYVNALNIVDSTYHYNDTGVAVGGFECSSSHYLIAGNSYDQSVSANLMSVHRNIFVTATPKDDFTDEATTVNWLTSYTADDGVILSPPHLVKISAERFLLTWTENGALKYCFLDAEGQLVGEITDGEGSLSDCVPIVDGNRALWYVTDDSAPVFHEIDLTEPHEHTYTSATTQPTCTEGGYTTHTCTICGESFVDSYTDALGHRFCEWYTVEEATCTESGRRQRDCARCNATQTETISATGHKYLSTITDPTCTEQGYVIHACEACGDTYTDGYTAALGHDWEGTDCTRCDATRLTPFDDVEEGSFYESPVAWAVEEGVTNGISATEFGPTVTCNRAQVVTFLWRAMGCPEPASATHPFADVQPGSFYEKAVLWAVENGITNGLDAAHFGPNEPCNRAQVVTFLWRAMGQPAAEGASPFADVREGDFFYAPVLWAVANGITNGMGDGTFGVNTTCNRAQTVTFLFRTFA